MGEFKYALENLRRHSETVRAQSAAIQREQRSFIDRSFAEFSDYLAEVERQPATLERNVRLMLACKLLNHVYSSLILAEYGLIVDAILCERNALETVAFHWLISLDPDAAKEYERGNIPRPVEVRQRLEQLGADMAQFKDIYASGSEVSHVGRRSERFHSRWESPSEGQLLFGGALAPDDQAEMFRFLPALLHLFRQPLTK